LVKNISMLVMECSRGKDILANTEFTALASVICSGSCESTKSSLSGVV